MKKTFTLIAILALFSLLMGDGFQPSTNPSIGYTLTVGKSGGVQYNTIQAALNAAAAGDTILVYPGSYSETLTITQNNLTIEGTSYTGVLITSASGTLINNGARTVTLLRNLALYISAPTASSNVISVTTGSVIADNCVLSLDQTGGAIAPSYIATVTTGDISFSRCVIDIDNSTTHVGDKACFSNASSGSVMLDRSSVSCDWSGGHTNSALTTIGTGDIEIKNSSIDIDDDSATNVYGIAIITTTGDIDARYSDFDIQASLNNATAYLALINNVGATVISENNTISVLSTGIGGAEEAYSFGLTLGAITSRFDELTAVDGINQTGGTLSITSVNNNGMLSDRYIATILAVTGDSDAVNVASASIVRVHTNAVTIGGFDGGVEGQIIYITNENTANNLVLENQEGTASAEDRIVTGSGGDVTITNEGGATLIYTSSRWRIIGVQQ